MLPTGLKCILNVLNCNIENNSRLQKVNFKASLQILGTLDFVSSAQLLAGKGYEGNRLEVGFVCLFDKKLQLGATVDLIL